VFTLASAGCALSQTIGQLIFFRAVQGLSTGAGIVVSRAIIRDMFAPSQAQKVMSQVTLFFGVAPAIAPMVGGWLLIHTTWHAIFWFLCGVGVLLWVANLRLLPETLHVTQRQPFQVKHLLSGYWQLSSDPRFILLALASGVPFNGVFLYILSAPVFLGELLDLAPQQFFWFFVLTIGGIMGGAMLSGRLAGKMAPWRQIRIGFSIMVPVGCINVGANVLFKADVGWALFPIGVFALGWALMVPVVTLLVLDLYPMRRGMASSLQMCVGSTANGIVAGVISPLVMHSALGLAIASLLMMGVGLCSWMLIRHRWPGLGEHILHV
jgi:DHA1 family bicyclomycin/chloramphenicol resistance-like MFS transporter